MARPGLRTLLLGANASLLAAPIAAVLGLRLYDTYLVRQTERQLIAQGVVIGELWRELYAEEALAGAATADAAPVRQLAPTQEFRPPARAADRFVPIEPVTSLGEGVLPPQELPVRFATQADTPAERAGARLEPVLARAQTFNLTAVRVLDAEGCVVATTRGERGACLDHLVEVRRALAGEYAAVVRERVSDEPLPPLSDVRSRGSVRVFSALPLFADGQVIGVVRVSRTSLDALTSLWQDRRGLLVVLGATLLALTLVSLGFATLVAQPLFRLTRAARRIARGEGASPLVSGPLAPAEVHELGAALAVMTERLQRRADDVEDFARTVSHELKTPITAIRGAAELLLDGAAHMDEAQRARFVANIDADAARLERLVSGLLHLTRIESAAPEEEDVDVVEFARRLGERYGARVVVALESAADAPPARLCISPEHLWSALQNLVDNALAYGGDGEVQVSFGRAAERLCVLVRDRGPGISEKNRPRVFERFFTTGRERGGTGLGLAIVAAIAERRGGEVSFVSGAGGTSFRLVL